MTRAQFLDRVTAALADTPEASWQDFIDKLVYLPNRHCFLCGEVALDGRTYCEEHDIRPTPSIPTVDYPSFTLQDDSVRRRS